MTEPDYSEPLSPVQIEAKLRRLVNGIALAQADLRLFRMKEAEATVILMRAKVSMSMSSACPQVKRGEVTVGDREDWIDAQTINERSEAVQATALREIAQDALRARIAESQAVQSLNASIRQAYSLSGHS